MRDERVNDNSALYGGFERTLDLRKVKAKDGERNALFRRVDRVDERSRTVTGLHDELHRRHHSRRIIASTMEGTMDVLKRGGNASLGTVTPASVDRRKRPRPWQDCSPGGLGE